jgi:uncharacterized membrane protein (UPF0182 family)
VSAPTGGLDLEASTAARADARGRLRVVPAANGLAYARPEYRIGTDGAPALAGVVAFAGDSTRVGGTVAAAIAPPPDASGGAAPAGADGDPLRRARELYAESRAALRRGDWTSVGRALDALGTVLGAPTPARPAP